MVFDFWFHFLVQYLSQTVIRPTLRGSKWSLWRRGMRNHLLTGHLLLGQPAWPHRMGQENQCTLIERGLQDSSSFLFTQQFSRLPWVVFLSWYIAVASHCVSKDYFNYLIGSYILNTTIAKYFHLLKWKEETYFVNHWYFNIRRKF